MNRLRAAAAAAFMVVLSHAAAAQGRPSPDVATWRGLEIVPGEVIVQFSDTATQQAQDLVHDRCDSKRLQTLTSQMGLVRAPANVPLDLTLERYTADPAVAFAYPNTIHRPTASALSDDPMYSSQWGLASVNAPDAWALETGSSDVVIAIIDSGLDSDHPDLAAHYTWGLDPYGGDSDPDDTDGHGTHCAGIAAGVTGNGIGIAGLARGCRLAGYRCGNSTFASSTLIAAIHDARTRGAHVLSMSWGSYGLNPAIRNALQDAHDDGCVLIAAAGNDNTSSKLYPAALDFVISVGATKKGDARASFSNYGSWVSIAAPGQQITSTYKNGQYATLNGTSMATPLVSGAAGLIYSRLGGERSPKAAAMVRAALEDTSVDIGSWIEHGRIDAAAALAAVKPGGGGYGVPQIKSSEPAAWEALGGTRVTVTGTNFSGADRVTIDDALVLASSLDVISDSELVFTTAHAGSLGSSALVVHRGATASAPFKILVEATSPPRVEVPSAIAQDVGFSWEFGGPPDATGLLLISLDNKTFSHRGEPVLLNMFLLWGDTLDHAGLASLNAVCPRGIGGLTFYSQLVTKEGSAFGASAIRKTTVSK